MQRIGGHHGRVSSQTGCATPITADALTGRNTGCRTTPDWSRSTGNSSPGSRRRQRHRMAAAGPAGRQAARWPQARRRYVPGDDADVLRRNRARLSSGTRRQVARCAASMAACRVAAPARYCPRTADVAARRCAGRTVRCDTSRPPRCWTGCRSDAAAATRKPPRPAQRGRRRRSPPARGERIGASEDAARLLACMWYGLSSWQRPSGQPGGVPLGGVFGQRQAGRQTVAQRAPVRGRHVDGGDALPSMPSMRSSTARTAFRLRRAAAGVRPAARRGCAACRPAAWRLASP